MRHIAFAILFLLGAGFAPVALAQTVITQAKALAGNVTPGDTAGYPITISQPGAYRLDSNLTVSPNTYGIYVSASNVDIDMNGFTLAGGGTATWGVISPNSESRIHDGVINRFRYSGIYLRGSSWVIDDMQIVRNGTLGVDATGAQLITIKDATVTANGSTGLRVGADGRIETSNVSRNGADGVSCAARCYVAGNSVNANTLNGILIDNDGGTVIDNVASNNGRYGLYAVLVTSDFTGPRVVGLGNNSFILNNSGPRLGGFEIQPNFCYSQPC